MTQFVVRRSTEVEVEAEAEAEAEVHAFMESSFQKEDSTFNKHRQFSTDVPVPGNPGLPDPSQPTGPCVYRGLGGSVLGAA